MLFVIQSLPRCGTHMLRSALQSHGALTCFGEVFNPDAHQHPFSQQPQPAEVIEYCQRQSQPTGFVAHAYTGLASDETGPGLDDEYRSRRDVKAAQSLWRMIPQNARVVTLYRENLLARYVSNLLANRRRVWNVRAGNPIPEAIQLELDCQKMLAHFAHTETLVRIARERFPNALRVSYESMVEQREYMFAKVQDYLGVERRSLTPNTLKLGRPLTETILNLDEVHRVLRNTRYENYLEALV